MCGCELEVRGRGQHVCDVNDCKSIVRFGVIDALVLRRRPEAMPTRFPPAMGTRRIFAPSSCGCLKKSEAIGTTLAMTIGGRQQTMQVRTSIFICDSGAHGVCKPHNHSYSHACGLHVVVAHLGSFTADQATTIEVAIAVKGIKGEVRSSGLLLLMRLN